MKRNILAVCDPEEAYLRRITQALSEKREFPFEVQGFASPEKLHAFTKKKPVQLLLAAETVYRPAMREWTQGSLFLLTEGGSGERDGLPCILKYQPLEALIRDLLANAAKEAVVETAALPSRPLRVIGVYTPVGRCLQTTFSFVLGRQLAKRYKVLYLNLESFSALGKLLHRTYQSDVTDLVCSISSAKEKFIYQLESMTEKAAELDYIPPALSYQDLTLIEGREWLQLFEEIQASGIYEYLVLDLSDCVQGLFEILRCCEKVYTITREDAVSQAKVEQYESVLKFSAYEDVLTRTRKFCLPVFCRLPASLEQTTLSELGEFVSKMLQEEKEKGGILSHILPAVKPLSV